MLATLSALIRGRSASASASLAKEAEVTPGPWRVDEGWIPSSWGSCLNWWQLGKDPVAYGESAVVEACISAYAQTIAMLPAAHEKKLDNGGKEEITSSALARILRTPNDYQTSSDFFLNLIRSLFCVGNAYAVALRNARFEVESLHLLPPKVTWPQIAPDGSVFYAVGGNPLLDPLLSRDEMFALPARDVLHIRLNTSWRNPLVGETPLLAAAWALAQSGAITRSSAMFFNNMSRPSGTLSTDLVLTKEQIGELRERWNQHSQGLNVGQVPILSAGLKWQALSVNAVDSQVVEQLKWSATDIMRVMRIPSAMVNDLTGSTFQSTEALMQWWLASGLGFVLNHVELAFDRFFELKRGQQTVFDTSELLRSAFAARIEGLVKAVQGGIYSPNEARAREQLPAVDDGDEPRVQQQVVPLSYYKDQLKLQQDKAKQKAPAPVPPGATPPADGTAPPATPPATSPATPPPTKEMILATIKAARDAKRQRAA